MCVLISVYTLLSRNARSELGLVASRDSLKVRAEGDEQCQNCRDPAVDGKYDWTNAGVIDHITTGRSRGCSARNAGRPRLRSLLHPYVRRSVCRGGRGRRHRGDPTPADAGWLFVGGVLNAKTARSQPIGGMTFGVGMAPLEGAGVDPRSGAFVQLRSGRLPRTGPRRYSSDRCCDTRGIRRQSQCARPQRAR